MRAKNARNCHSQLHASTHVNLPWMQIGCNFCANFACMSHENASPKWMAQCTPMACYLAPQRVSLVLATCGLAACSLAAVSPGCPAAGFLVPQDTSQHWGPWLQLLHVGV